MAAPWQYADKSYLNLLATLDGGKQVTVKIDRYLKTPIRRTVTTRTTTTSGP